MNEARLFSVETRINEEEEMRIREYEYVRDLLKKLCYSLEQVNMQQIDTKGFSNQLNLNSEPSGLDTAAGVGLGGGADKLPNLLGGGNDNVRQSMQ